MRGLDPHMPVCSMDERSMDSSQCSGSYRPFLQPGVDQDVTERCDIQDWDVIRMVEAQLLGNNIYEFHKWTRLRGRDSLLSTGDNNNSDMGVYMLPRSPTKQCISTSKNTQWISL